MNSLDFPSVGSLTSYISASSNATGCTDIPPCVTLTEISNADERLEAVHEVLMLLPPAHYETLRYLMIHLKK